jgi:outer membrane receptor for ferrienterochelin and colicin
MIFLAALLFSSVLTMADELTLNGTVGDLDGRPLAEAKVVLEHTTDRARWETPTSADGEFRFERLPYGSYNLRVTKDGYFGMSTDLRLEVSKTFEFSLVPIETRHEEVEVIARPEPINVDAVSEQQNVNDEVIQNLPYTGRRNFLNALSLMPGVLQDNRGQLHIHGSRSDQIRYQLDGMNVTDPSGGLASNIPIDAIESVDVDLAGYSSEYGKGSGGVLRVQSQFVGDKLRWDFTDFIPGVNFKRRTISDLSPRVLVSGPIVRTKAWFMYSGSLRYVRTFNEDLPEGQNRQNQTEGEQLLKLQWNLGESHVLTMNLLSNTEYYGNSGLSRIRPMETTTNFLRRGTTAAVSNRSVIRGTLLETIIQWTHRRDSDLAKGTSMLTISPAVWTGNFYTDRRGRSDRFHVAQTVSRERPWHGITHRFKAGAEFDYVVSNLELNRRPFRLLGSSGALKQEVQFDGPSSAEINNREIGFFIQDRIVLGPKVQIELGARGDRESVAGPLNVAPRFAFSFLPLGTTKSKISGGVGLFYDNLALENLQLSRMQRRLTTSYLPDGTASETVAAESIGVDPALRNPYGVHWNVAWEYEMAPRWVTRVNFTEKRGHEQVRLAAIQSNDTFDLVFNNSGKSKYDAIELSLDRPIRTNLRVLASYTYSQSMARPSLSVDFPDPALELIDHAVVEWNTPHRFVSWGYFPFFFNSSASFAMEVRSGFPFSPQDDLQRIVAGYNSMRYPAFFVTNFSVEKEVPVVFGKRVAVRVGVTNLLNRFNPRFVDPNVNSPTFLRFSDSSSRAFVARVRLLNKTA